MSNASIEDSHAVHLDSIGQIAISVSDLQQSTDFYRNILGMKFLFDAGSMAFFQCGTIRLMLGTSDKPVTGTAIILYFKVQDIQETHAILQDLGVPFIQKPHLVARMPDHDLWMAFLKDPDDNTLALMSEVPNAA